MRSMHDSTPQPTPLIRRPEPLSISATAGYLEALERRLTDGYTRIEVARSRGQDVTAWEEFWIELLHQYEMAVDDFPEAA